MAETQFPGWRLHKRRGEALKYTVPTAFAAGSLLSFYSGVTAPGFSLAAQLPAGAFININGQLYITRNSAFAGQVAEMDPLNWHPTYIMPKASVSITTDRTALYWDQTNCVATTTAGSNKFIGYSVPNNDLATGSVYSATGTTITAAGTLTAFDSQTQAYTLTGGSSGDGVENTYQTTDKYVEVEVVVSNSISVGGGFGPIQNITAVGANNSATAAALGQGYYYVSGANNNAGVILASGTACRLKNAAAATATELFVWPPVGGAINGGSTNAAYNLGGTYTVELTPAANNSLQFYTFPTTAS
jgi:hypothetical protein